VAVARRVRDGEFRPEPQRLGMREGIVALEVNERLRGQVAPEIWDEVARAEARIRSGELVVPRGGF
jgi:basic membrane lipoprotein Med (substrate-binding protein (PBP1-ABC) superfamily)